MKDFKKNAGFRSERGERTGGFSRPSFGGSRGFSRPPSGFKKSDMHDAVCSKCNKACQVPFLPNGKKPVFCNDCHVSGDTSRDTRSSFPRKEFTPRSFGAPTPGGDDTARQLATLNKKLDALIEKIDALLEG